MLTKTVTLVDAIGRINIISCVKAVTMASTMEYHNFPITALFSWFLHKIWLEFISYELLIANLLPLCKSIKLLKFINKEMHRAFSMAKQGWGKQG